MNLFCFMKKKIPINKKKKKEKRLSMAIASWLIMSIFQFYSVSEILLKNGKGDKYLSNLNIDWVASSFLLTIEIPTRINHLNAFTHTTSSARLDADTGVLSWSLKLCEYIPACLSVPAVNRYDPLDKCQNTFIRFNFSTGMSWIYWISFCWGYSKLQWNKKKFLKTKIFIVSH